MVLIWFIYGLAFFLMGFGISVYPKRGSVFKLAGHIWLIATFGIIHGINEWIDMFIGLGKPISPEVLTPVRMITLVVSFVFLMMFGTEVIAATKRGYGWLRLVPVAVFLVCTTIFVLSSRRYLVGDIMARYLICFPGTILAAYGLWMQINELRKTHLRAVIWCLKTAAVVLLCYGVAAGLIVKKAGFFPASYLNYDLIFTTLGVPIQLIRAFCAVILAGSLLYVLSVFHWETQEVILRSEERFSAIASAMPLFLFAVDLEWKITFAKGDGLKRIDLEAAEMIGKSVTETFGLLPQVLGDIQRALAGEEFGASLRKGEVVFDAHYLPLRSEEGDMVGSMCLALDVSGQAKAQEQLDEYRRQVEKNAHLAEIGTLSSLMVGQMEDPLKVAGLRLQMLLSDMDKDQTVGGISMREMLKKALGEIASVSGILRKFQHTAQIESKEHREVVDFYRIGKTMVEVFGQSSRRVNLKIKLRKIDCYVRMSMAVREIEQIFFALIQNALDLTDPTKPQQLTISCEVGEGQVELLFTDDFGEVSAEKLATMFEAFPLGQWDAKVSSLGLAVAKRMVMAHGGDIEAESIAGVGTRFRVIIPAEAIA